MASIRFALSLVAAALVLGAAPARAACSRLCDEEYDLGGGAAAAHPAMQHKHPPPVEMTLPGYLWTRLREEAHAYADKAAYALITATSRLAVAAAREQQAAQEDAPTPAAPSVHGECSKQGA